MPKITFLPDQVTLEVPVGTPLAQAAADAGVRLSIPCAGKGICGKCLVLITQGSVEFDNNGKLSQELQGEGYVLACRSKVSDSDITLQLPSKLSDEEGSFSDAMSHIGIKEELFPVRADFDPLVKRIRVSVAQPEMLDGLGDYDRFAAAVTQELGLEHMRLPMNLLQSLPEVLRAQEGAVNVWYYLLHGVAHIADIRAEEAAEYGVAVDIGTTTVAVQLVDMNTGKIIASKTGYNAQIERGLDVISRISYAKNRERIDEMRALVLQTVNDCVRGAAQAAGVATQDIRNASVAGNTTMVELLLGIVPDYIRLEPYTPAVMHTPLYPAWEVGLHICNNAAVFLAPNVGSYVGGDITSGLLCTDFALDSEEVNLFIDIGTNGEIVFGNNDFLLACACSAGPAFEGGGIEFGMRASAGAIESVSVDSQGVCTYGVIGEEAPKGICGSGLISLVAQLLDAGVIDQRGKFNTSGQFPMVDATDARRPRYYIVPATEGDRGIYLTEADIDNLIRAKAAIFSACLTLMRSVEMDFDCLSNVYIAGGFGRYIDIEKAQTIGLLPNLETEQFKFIGNSSLAGAHMTLVSAKHLAKELELTAKITYVDLSTEPSYMDEYISAMFLPHTDERMFAKKGE